MPTIHIKGSSHWDEHTVELTISGSEKVTQTTKMTAGGVTVETTLTHTRAWTRTITATAPDIAALEKILPAVAEVMEEAHRAYEEINPGIDLEGCDIEARAGVAETSIRVDSIEELEALVAHPCITFS
jgi:hypothetical protein